MDLGLVPVHAFGPCLRNQNVTDRINSKVGLFRDYKFCVAMENSIEGEARCPCERFVASGGAGVSTSGGIDVLFGCAVHDHRSASWGVWSALCCLLYRCMLTQCTLCTQWTT